jgi:transposase-like protein
MDAKHVAGKQFTVALGVTVDGKKIPLGFVEASTYAWSRLRASCETSSIGDSPTTRDSSS